MSTPAPGCTVAADGSVTFAYRDPHAAEVRLAADFDGWSPAARPMRGEAGLFTLTLPALPPGLHAYKYVVDGRFVADPENPRTVDDGCGERNSSFVAGALPLGDPSALRVASLNLHTYQEARAVYKLEQIAVSMATLGADVLLFQEVGEHESDRSRPNAGEVVRSNLERSTGRPWHHETFAIRKGFDVYWEGLSILSATPLTDVRKVVLREGGLSRIAVIATTTVKGVPLRVVTAHLTWAPDGDTEAEALLAQLGETPAGTAATLVAGDFNGTPDSAHVRRLIRAGYVDVGAQQGATGPTFLEGALERIDYHFLRPAAGQPMPAVRAFARIFDGAAPSHLPRVSDHAGLVAAYAFR